MRKVNRRKRKKRGNEVKKENVEEVKDANGEDENLDQDEFVEPFYEVEPMEDYILREQPFLTFWCDFEPKMCQKFSRP